ncbi:lipopolysaccharide biosynthesis protein [Butyrivibrio sp. AE2032]|uniref:lipopolysaccharide biosynthesis protein n=1 Tax=Butyrivibrio sp. AE2032 TaxID=1458463 RepID=UPI000555980D|nr:oligosaccharide flippase family protein [Butyrivibrio sp. AE2032]
MQQEETNRKYGGVQFLSQMIYFSFGPIGGAFFAFLASITAAWLIDPGELGRVSLFTTAITLTTLVSNLGLDRAYMREFASSKNKEELLYNCLCVSLCTSIVASILIILLRQPIAGLLFDNSDYLSIAILAVILPIDIIGEYSIYTCRLYGNVKKYTIASIIQQLSYLIYIVGFYCLGIRGYRTIIFARALSMATKSIVAVFLEREHYCFFGKLNKSIITSALRYGVPYMPALICSWVLNSMDKYALRIWSTYDEIGFYTSAFTIVSVLAIVRNAFNSFWTPLAYKWYDEGEDVSYFEKVGDYITVILIVLSSLIILLRNVIFKIYKPEYSHAANILPFLLFVISMETISYVVGCGINLKKKTIFNLVATASACVINLIGNYILVPRMGGVGASISTGMSCMAYMLIKMFISRTIWYKFSIIRYLINILLITAMSACAIIFNSIFVDVCFATFIIIYNLKSIYGIWAIMIRFVKKRK